MGIEVVSGRTGTFRAEVIAYGPSESPTLATSPDYPGDEAGMSAVIEWCRGELEARLGPTWRAMHGADAFMTPEELDGFRPGWRSVPYVTAGSEEVRVRVIDRPLLAPTLELTCMTVPIRRSIEDDEATLGIIIHGPTMWTEDALESLPTFSLDEIGEMAAGLRKLSKSSRN